MSLPKVITKGSLVQVRNSFSKKIHLWLSGCSTALCSWKCGTQEQPALQVNFCVGLRDYPPEENVKNLCGRCCSESKAKMCANIAVIPLKTDFLLADDGMSSDSESESDEDDEEDDDR